METLATFIWKRLQELSVLEAEVQARMDELHAERDQLRKAALAAGIETDSPPEQKASQKTEEIQQRRFQSVIRKLPTVTLKQAVLIVLKEQGHPMQALDILDAINKKFDADFPRTSLSPQLSRLKDDNLLERDGRIWHLTEIGSVAALEATAQYELLS